MNAYNKRISGPLLDRIDLRLTIFKTNHEHFFDTNLLKNKQQPKVLSLVLKAREAQSKRYKRRDFYNAYASIEDAQKLFMLEPKAKQLLDTAATTLHLTSRGYLRVLRVARTIADLDSSRDLMASHVAEALQFRS